MKTLPFLLLIALTALPAHPSFSDASSNPGRNYVMGNDDVIDIAVLNHTDLDRELTVLPDGTITYLWAGRYQAAGLTPADLASSITKDLEKRYNNVEVSVSVAHVQSLTARVTGSVMKPGAYDIKPKFRVMDLVTLAGGFSTRPAQISGRLIHKDGSIIPLDIARAVADPESDQNPRLAAGDLLLLDQRDPVLSKVYVMGQVNKPGAYDLGDNGLALYSLLAQAGNPTPTAALTAAYVRRGDEDIPLDLRPTLIDGKADPKVEGFEFQAGDVLYVPEIQSKIAVVGEVTRPGEYVLPEGKTSMVLDGISLAGGQTVNADLHHVSVVRTVNGKQQVATFDLGRAVRGDMDMDLQPNDVIYVPSAENRVHIKDILAPLALLGAHLLP